MHGIFIARNGSCREKNLPRIFLNIRVFFRHGGDFAPMGPLSAVSVIRKNKFINPSAIIPRPKKNPRDRERIGLEDPKQDCLVFAEGAKYWTGSESV